MSASAAAAAPAAPAVPINATIERGGPLPTVAQPPPGPGDHQAAAIAAARAAQKTPAAPAPAPAATPPAQATPAAADKADGKGAEAKADDAKGKDQKPNTVTQRIADLTRQLREEKAARAADQARAADLEQQLTGAKSAAQKLDIIAKAFKEDPLQALEQLGEKWSDIVIKVANGGRQPTPEEAAAAERERAEKERDARLKVLEEERKAEKEAAELAAEKQATESAVAFIANEMIKPADHPFLVGIREDAAAEAMDQVSIALQEAFKAGKRPSPHPKSLQEAQELTTLALTGINNYYRDLAQRIAPAPKAAEQTSATQAPATVAPTTEAAQQRRPISTITNAVAGGESPAAAQPERLTAEEARAKAVANARRLPDLL